MKNKDVINLLERYGRLFGVDLEDRIKILESIQDKTVEMGSDYESYRLAIYSLALSRYDDAILYAKKALEDAYKKNNEYLIVEVNLFIGIHYRMSHQFDLAFNFYFAAMKIGPSARIYNNMADIYLLTGGIEEADDLLTKAIDLLLKEPVLDSYHKRLLQTIYTNQCEVALGKRQFEKVKSQARKLIDTAVEGNDLLSYGYGKLLLGSADIELMNYDDALRELKESHDVFLGCDASSINQVRGYIEEVVYLQAMCLHCKKDYETSLFSLNSLSMMNMKIYELKIKNHEALNHIDKAYEVHKQLLEYLNNEEVIRKRRQVENFKNSIEVYETIKKVHEYELLYSHTKSISEIGRQIISAEKIDDVINAIFMRIGEIMEFNTLALGILCGDIVYYNWIIEDNEKLEAYEVSAFNKNSLTSWVIRHNQPIRLNDAGNYDEISKYKEVPKLHWIGDTMDTFLIVPIIFKNEVLGVVNLQSSENFQYTEYDLEVITMLASFIGVAMKNWENTNGLIEANEKLQQLSKTDALTGISNRHILSEIVEDLFKADGDANHNISVAIVDIDHFKEYNDTYGHIEGDRCIIKIVEALRVHLDISPNRLFRYGGDEFVAILPYSEKEEIDALLNKAKDAVENLKIENVRSKVSPYVTCTFGYTTVIKGNKDYQRAFYLADEALYLAKANGKNQVRFIADEES